MTNIFTNRRAAPPCPRTTSAGDRHALDTCLKHTEALRTPKQRLPIGFASSEKSKRRWLDEDLRVCGYFGRDVT